MSDMNKFYNEIADKYDYIFPLSDLQKKFMLEEIIGTSILDVGAATGNLSKFLISNNLNVTSIDINDKLISVALDKQVTVKNLDMLNIDRLGLFDTIINIGNTLPHLHSKNDVFSFLEKSYYSLNQNGKLILQIINFNKFLSNPIHSNYLGDLPLIENSFVKFKRSYYINNENNIIFKTILNDYIENEEILLNLNKDDIMECLEKIGFENIKCYGGFDKTTFDSNDSLFLIIIANKKL